MATSDAPVVRPLFRGTLVSASALAGALAPVAPAGASQLIARNASRITLGVDAKGTALIAYSYGGKVTHLPDLGMAPWLAPQKTWWLHLSHWTGPIAQLEVHADWIYSGRYQEVFGRYTYRGVGIRGFGTTHFGAPTDGYGRLVFLDTYGSAYGPGWVRENSFVSHGPPGMFCYGSTAGIPGSAATRIRRGCRSEGGGPGPASDTGSPRRGPASPQT